MKEEIKIKKAEPLWKKEVGGKEKSSVGLLATLEIRKRYNGYKTMSKHECSLKFRKPL